MDIEPLAAAAASGLLSGGIVGGLVSLVVSKRESRDRQEALAFEREKWERTAKAEHRADVQRGCRDALEYLAEIDVLAEDLQTEFKKPVEERDVAYASDRTKNFKSRSIAILGTIGLGLDHQVGGQVLDAVDYGVDYLSAVVDELANEHPDTTTVEAAHKKFRQARYSAVYELHKVIADLA